MIFLNFNPNTYYRETGKSSVLIDMVPADGGRDIVIGFSCINTPPDTKKLKYLQIRRNKNHIYDPHIFFNLDKCVLLLVHRWRK